MLLFRIFTYFRSVEDEDYYLFHIYGSRAWSCCAREEIVLIPCELLLSLNNNNCVYPNRKKTESQLFLYFSHPTILLLLFDQSTLKALRLLLVVVAHCVDFALAVVKSLYIFIGLTVISLGCTFIARVDTITCTLCTNIYTLYSDHLLSTYTERESASKIINH